MATSKGSSDQQPDKHQSETIRVLRRKLSDYLADPRNANRGTERGRQVLRQSIEDVGLARSIVAAADGTIPAGNKTLEAAAEAGIEDVIEVETDGHTLVVVKRTDWDSVDHEKARRYAYYDNRASELDLNWNPEQILADLNSGVDLSGLWTEDELHELLQALEGVEDALPPDGWSEYDEDIETEYCCPKCGYRWSGKPA